MTRVIWRMIKDKVVMYLCYVFLHYLVKSRACVLLIDMVQKRGLGEE
jgi:hypothetical protein